MVHNHHHIIFMWRHRFTNLQDLNKCCDNNFAFISLRDDCCNLSLGLVTKARACKVASQEGSSGVTSHAPGSAKCVREWTLTLPNEFPFWELESQWTFESLEGDYRGQNSLIWRHLYIIRNLLKCRCQKWARITHLDIWITSYGQKKGHESNWQFDSPPLKVGNQPDFVVCRWCAT